MRKTIIVLAVLVMGTVLCAGDHHHKTDGIKHYVAAQEALAIDSYESAKQSLRMFIEETDGVLKKLAETAYKAKNLEDLRLQFKPLSEKIAGAAHLPQGLVVAYCPMAKAHWVQKNGEVANPYYGSTMLRCGTIKKTVGEE